MFGLVGVLVVSILLFLTSIMGYLSFKADEPPSMKKKFVVGMLIVSPMIIIGSIIALVRRSGNKNNSPSPVAPAAAIPTPAAATVVPEPIVAKLNNKNRVN